MRSGRGPADGPPPPLAGCADPLATAYDVALLDLDGVVYRGPHPVAMAADAVAAARAAGMRIAYVTNNASRPPAAVAEQLRGLGLPAEAGDVVTSAQAAARVVADRFPPGTRVLPVGGIGLREALTEAGFALVRSLDERPQVVVQGFAPDLRYADLAEAALAVRAGAWWVATNGDLTLPTERGVQPGNGALVGAVAAAVGRGPASYAGKPDPTLMAEAIRRTGARRPLVVGDRLDTDIEGASAAGLPSLCVLTGVSSGTDIVLATGRRRPTYVGADLRALLQPHSEPQPTPLPAAGSAPNAAGATAAAAPATWRCGGWTASVEDGSEVAVAGAGDPVDLLRAVAAAAWAAAASATGGGNGDGPCRLRVSDDAAAKAARAVRLDALLAAGSLPGRGEPVG